MPHRTAMSTWHSRSTSVGTIAPVGCSTGTVSVNVPLPVRRHVSVIGGIRREVLGELRDAAVEAERGLVVLFVPLDRG